MSLGTDGAVVDDGAAGDRVGAVVDRNRWVNKAAVGVEMAGANFGDLAWAARDRVLVTVYARSGVEDWT